MQANDLNTLEALIANGSMKAVHALIDELEGDALEDLVLARVVDVSVMQGRVLALRDVRKMLSDVKLLRSLQDNPNVDPVTDKE